MAELPIRRLKLPDGTPFAPQTNSKAVTYDKTASGLVATTVQEAIDALADAVTTAGDGGTDDGAAADVQKNLDAHTGNTTVHITAAERSAWNAKVDKADGTLAFTFGRDANGVYVEY